MALPAIALAGPAVHATASPDVELIRLAKQIADLKIQSDAAAAEYDRCYAIYESMNPQPSPKLLRLGRDVVGVSRKQLPRDGKIRLWCDFGQVDELRDQTFFGQWVFTGTEQEREKLGLENWCDSRIKPDRL